MLLVRVEQISLMDRTSALGNPVNMENCRVIIFHLCLLFSTDIAEEVENNAFLWATVIRFHENKLKGSGEEEKTN